MGAKHQLPWQRLTCTGSPGTCLTNQDAMFPVMEVEDQAEDNQVTPSKPR